MSRLDDYRFALLAAHPDVPDDDLVSALDARGAAFAQFIIDHGLGPLWHERIGRQEFYAARMQAEALFAAQERAMRESGSVLEAAGIPHAVIKGAATRYLIYDNPAVRSCFDIDILVGPDDKMRAAESLVALGYKANPERRNISRELVLSRSGADIDLHWGLLREGRLRSDPTKAMMTRRRHVSGIWMPSSEDTLFILLVHPAFAKHLAGWGMGLHRVADLLRWLGSQSFDWSAVKGMLIDNGVAAAAWATLRWSQFLTSGSGFQPQIGARLDDLAFDLQPGLLRRRWLEYWLRNDLPGRASRARWARLLGFSTFLHDTSGDAFRAAAGRGRAKRRAAGDLEMFQRLEG